jgi:large repetitive protein
MRNALALSLLLLLGCPKDPPVDDTGPPEDTAPEVVDVDEDGYAVEEDCNDRDASINPGAEEVCDGIDNNCDGTVDEGVTVTGYADSDGDGFGDAATEAELCELTDGWVEDATDCDDSRDDVFPGADEPCDGVDNDCDDEVDEDGDSVWYQDADGDGQGDSTTYQVACSPGDGWSANADDCDDSRDDVYAGADEVCDGADNDCDGAVDEDATTTFYADADNDGYGDPSATTQACDQPEGYVLDDQDCDDADYTVNPAALERCNEQDDDCDGDVDEGVTTTYYADADNDGYGDAAASTEACEQPRGYVSNILDCDDSNAALNPDAAEYCDGFDNDCDGTTDNDDAVDATTWYMDADGDSFGDLATTTTACSQPSGYVALPTDCDDADAAVNPDASEICDEVDNDCDGTVDTGAVDAGTWYLDDDGDGYGAAGTSDTQVSCDQPPGYAASSDDCGDDDFVINPGAAEVCDEVDNDCDGLVDVDDPGVTDSAVYYADADSDGYGDATAGLEACDQPSGYVTHGYASDCDDGDATVNPFADEICDGQDNDCDGLVDDDDSDLVSATSWYADADGDSYGDAGGELQACTQPSGYIADGSDCDDGDPAVNPGADEYCDGVNNDCDSEVDEEAVDAVDFYADTDGDGYGDATAVVWECSAPTGYVADSADCDDSDPTINPVATEVCSGGDMDCDGVVPDLCVTCAEQLLADPTAIDGLYVVDLDGTGSGQEVWCDMSTDGGGWTLVQRTVWDWDLSSELLTGWTEWLGSTLGDPDEGYAYRMAGELWTELNVDLDHMIVNVARDGSDGSDCDPLYYKGTTGTLAITSTTAEVTGLVSSVTIASNDQISTTDSGPNSSCVNSPKYGVPWYYGLCCITCPTYGPAWTDEPHPMASYVDTTGDLNGNIDADVCPSGSAVHNGATGTGSYEGMNAMEYYLR